MDHVIELASKRSGQAEVYRVWRRDTPVDFEANRLKLLQSRESSGTALRIVKNGRIGLSATNDPDEIDGLIDRAEELARFGAEAKFELPGPETYPDMELFDEETERISVEDMIELGQTMIDTLRKANSELLCEARVAKSVGGIEIANSRGGHASYRKSTFSVSIEGTLIRGTDMLFVGDYRTTSGPLRDTVPLTDRVMEQLAMAERTVPAPTGEVPVLFSPRGVASALIGPLTIGFNGRTVQQGASPLVGKLGEKLFDERLQVWDDPTASLEPGSRLADDEGVPSRRTALVEGGRAAAFLYDLQTAGLVGAESTGSAARSLGSLPRPSTSVIRVGPGDVRYDDMLAGIKDGLLVESLLGAGQGNVLGGEFGGNVLLGFRVQNGEVAGRVKDTVISGNVYASLNKLIAIGKEARWVGAGLHAPPMCCGGVTVSSKTD